MQKRVHEIYERGMNGIKCGHWRKHPLMTADPAKVTCLNCKGRKKVRSISLRRLPIKTYDGSYVLPAPGNGDVAAAEQRGAKIQEKMTSRRTRGFW